MYSYTSSKELRERCYLEDLSVYGKIILERIVKE
jgi:hypothetical protein